MSTAQEETVSASELRDQIASILDRVDKHRVLIQKHGRARAYLISVLELRSLEETVAILENQPFLEQIAAGLNDLRAGRVRDARDVFAELDAEFTNEGPD